MRSAATATRTYRNGIERACIDDTICIDEHWITEFMHTNVRRDASVENGFRYLDAKFMYYKISPVFAAFTHIYYL